MSEYPLIESTESVCHDKNYPISAWNTNAYIKAATSDNTRKAYQSDIRHFEKWGGRLPATPAIIIYYLQAYAEKLNPRTLARRLTALKNWHQYQDFPDPTLHPAIAKTLTGILRTQGKPKEKARALRPEELLMIVTFLQQNNSLLNLRDNALLQVGFFGAFRRSELVAIKVAHTTWHPEGIEISIPHSKTDQHHEGQYCALPYGKGNLCPVTALSAWLDAANTKEGEVFRRLHQERGGEGGITPLTVNHVLQKRAKQSGLNNIEQLSSHSLRRGFATSASKLGASMPAILRQGRWKHVNTVMEYIEVGERFSDNAVDSIMALFKQAE